MFYLYFELIKATNSGLILKDRGIYVNHKDKYINQLELHKNFRFWNSNFPDQNRKSLICKSISIITTEYNI